MASTSTRRTFLRLGAVCSVVGTAGCVDVVGELLDTTAADWPMLHRDARNTGYHADGSGPEEEVREAWTADVGEGVSASPAVVEDTVYIGSITDETGRTGDRDGYFYALDASTDERKWRFDADRPMLESSPAVVDGTVYVGTYPPSKERSSGRVYALDAATGEEQWTFDTGGYVRSSPTVVGDTVYVASEVGTVYALDAATGEQRWAFDIHGYAARGAPAVHDGIVYVGRGWTGGSRPTFFAIDAEAGTAVWTAQIGSVAVSPAVVDGTVYVANGRVDLDRARPPHLNALDAETGEERWAVRPDDPISGSTAVGDGVVYGGGGRRNDNFYAFDAATGEVRWRTGNVGRAWGAPVIVGGTIYTTYRTDVTGVCALDATSGEIRWSYRVDSPRSPVAVRDGRVYFGTGDGKVHALEGG